MNTYARTLTPPAAGCWPAGTNCRTSSPTTLAYGLRRECWTRCSATTSTRRTGTTPKSIASEAARYHGLDPYDAIWARLETHPKNDWLWGRLVPGVTEQRLAPYLDGVRHVVNDGKVRRFDDDAVGLVAPFLRTEPVLSDAVNVLARFPGQGVDLIESVLTAYVPYLRIAALDALRAWGLAAVPPDTLTLVRQARDRETSDVVMEHYSGLV